MPFFRLDLRIHRNEGARSLTFEAADAGEARVSAEALIADAFGRPGEFVMLDDESGKVIVGAGLWSRTGHFAIGPADPPPSRAPGGYDRLSG